MKELIVPYVEIMDKVIGSDHMALFPTSPAQQIDCNPWPQYDHGVQARFAIVHHGEAICLKFMVEEDQVKASANANGAVHRDSCVEFFVAFDGEGSKYYNLEFNCLGYGKVGYGSKRSGRKLLPLPLVESIRSCAKLNSFVLDGKKRWQWELVLLIPLSVFCYTALDTLCGKEGRANFYKCGDGLQAPHFLAWNNIEHPSPNFHLSDFFGRIRFD